MKKTIYTSVLVCALIGFVSACGKKDEGGGGGGAPAAAAATPAPTPAVPPENDAADYKLGFENSGAILKEAIKGVSLRVVNDFSDGQICVYSGAQCTPQPSRNYVKVSPPISNYPRIDHTLEVVLRFDALGRLNATITHDQVIYYGRNIAYKFTHPDDIPEFKHTDHVNLEIGTFKAIAANDASRFVTVGSILASQDVAGRIADSNSTSSVKRIDAERERDEAEAKERAEKRKAKAEAEAKAKADAQAKVDQKAKNEAANQGKGNTEGEKKATGEGSEKKAEEKVADKKEEAKPVDQKPAPKKEKTSYPLVFSIVNVLDSRSFSMTVSKIVQPSPVQTPANLPPGTQFYNAAPQPQSLTQTVLGYPQLVPQ